MMGSDMYGTAGYGAYRGSMAGLTGHSMMMSHPGMAHPGMGLSQSPPLGVDGLPGHMQDIHAG